MKPADSSRAASDLFDAEDLIFRMGQEELARLVAATFLQDAPVQLAALIGAAAAGDAKALRAAAHSLKGASGNAGSPRVYRLSCSVEAAAREGKLPLQLLQELGSAIHALEGPVSAFIAARQTLR